jgi:triosephosphate isomerase
VPAPRVPLVAGNWKMNPTSLEAAVRLAGEVASATNGLPVRTVVCPPALFLEAVAAAVGGGTIAPGGLGIGAQTMHAADSGAFTGEISPLMLRGLAQYVIVGHSERREFASETDEACAAKVASAVDHGLVPIAAIGERADERRAGVTAAVIERQLRAATSRLERIAGSGLVIAYEPVWAIGTGDAATADDAQAAAAQIRGILHEADPDGADEVPILYGGSCTPENAPDFFALPDIDGALVGGASLHAESFAAIVRSAEELRG